MDVTGSTSNKNMNLTRNKLGALLALLIARAGYANR
jgi:hypothetical protein